MSDRKVTLTLKTIEQVIADCINSYMDKHDDVDDETYNALKSLKSETMSTLDEMTTYEPSSVGTPIEVKPESMTLAELKAFVKEHNLEVEGTGKRGYIKKQDYITTVENFASSPSPQSDDGQDESIPDANTMTLKELRAYVKEHNVEIEGTGKNGRVLKTDLVEAVSKHLEMRVSEEVEDHAEVEDHEVEAEDHAEVEAEDHEAEDHAEVEVEVAPLQESVKEEEEESDDMSVNDDDLQNDVEEEPMRDIPDTNMEEVEEPVNNEKSKTNPVNIEEVENIIEEITQPPADITKEEFTQFVKATRSGSVTDFVELSKLSGLTEERVQDMTLKYPSLKDRYPDVMAQVELEMKSARKKGGLGKKAKVVAGPRRRLLKRK